MTTSTQGLPSRKTLTSILRSYWRGNGPILDPLAHFYEGRPPLTQGSYPLTRQGLAQLGQLWGVRSRDLTLAPPSEGVILYSSAVTSNIQTYGPHLANKRSRMSQTFNQGYLFDLNDPS
jgi:hypothetical protein